METTELTKPDSFIETELQRFENDLQITKESLVALADSVKDLVIKDSKDKEGLKAVIAGRKLLKTKRVLIEKGAKNTRESATRFQKAVIAREKEFVDLLEPTEEILAQREEFYYAELDRIRAQEEKQESDRIQLMIDKLNAVHYAVDFHELKALTDVQFENILTEATTKYNVALEEEKWEVQRQYELRLAEETRLAQAQKEQEERERKFREEQEQARIENERIRKEQEDRQRVIDEQQLKIQQEQDRINSEKDTLLENKKRGRVKQLVDIGLKFSGDGFLFEAGEIYINFHRTDILSFDDERWDKEYQKAVIVLDEYKKQLVKDEEARKKQQEIDRKKREKEEKEQMLLFGEDTDRFAFHMGNLERNYIHGGGISNHMKSKKAKQIAAEADYLIRQAYDLCKANMGDKNRSAVPITGNLD